MSTLKIDESWDLSRDEFADAIAKGLGRAFLYIKNHGLDNVKDLVLEACLEDLSYDPQCDTSRAKWLFNMFADSPYYPELRDKILAALLLESESHDSYQLCEMATEMALKGDTIAINTLEKYVYTLSSQPMTDDYWFEANQLIKVRGIAATIELSRIFGRRLLANPEDPVPPGWYLDFFKDISEGTIAIFERYVVQEEQIAIYYQHLIDTKRENERKNAKRASQPRKTTSIEEIIDLARNKRYEYSHVYGRFSIKATAAELEKIVDLLLNEPDEEICLRLLWVFWNTPMPRLSERVFGWIYSQDILLKTAVMKAISQISNDRIHQLGRAKLAKGQLFEEDIDTLNLFINNYHTGDAKLILDRLNNVEIDREDLHAIGFIIVNLSKKQNNPEVVILLSWIYDRNPCAICRERIVEQLESYHLLSDKLRAEYQFDSRQFGKESI